MIRTIALVALPIALFVFGLFVINDLRTTAENADFRARSALIDTEALTKTNAKLTERIESLEAEVLELSRRVRTTQ